MLIQYLVENYKSIKDEVVINFSVDKKYKDSDWAIRSDKVNSSLYNCIGLIGPNASGKSNIVESFRFAFRFILNTIKRKESSKIKVTPFARARELHNSQELVHKTVYSHECNPYTDIFKFLDYMKVVKIQNAISST